MFDVSGDVMVFHGADHKLRMIRVVFHEHNE
jgi:hypothetical protein